MAMNKIVRERYPASQLPDDLRVGLDSKAHVRVTIEQESPVSEDASRLRAMLVAARRASPADDDPVSRIRKLRDEWDD
jgi:hypothetical protein